MKYNHPRYLKPAAQLFIHYANRLRAFDWHYQHSDDSSVWHKCDHIHDELYHFSLTSARHERLYHHYAKETPIRRLHTRRKHILRAERIKAYNTILLQRSPSIRTYLSLHSSSNPLR